MNLHDTTGKGQYSPAFGLQLSKLTDTYAYIQNHIAEPELQVIRRAGDIMKQGIITPASPAYIELVAHLDTI